MRKRRGILMGLFKKITGALHAPEANISVNIGQMAFALGQEIQGSIQVAASEEFDAVELRVELEDYEQSKAFYRISRPNQPDITGTAEEGTRLYTGKVAVSGPLHVTKGFTGEYNFRIPIPANASTTYSGKNASNKWSIKGVIGVSGRPDVNSHEIEVIVVPAVRPT
jgi:hypothetical protein